MTGEDANPLLAGGRLTFKRGAQSFSSEACSRRYLRCLRYLTMRILVRGPMLAAFLALWATGGGCGDSGSDGTANGTFVTP